MASWQSKLISQAIRAYRHVSPAANLQDIVKTRELFDRVVNFLKIPHDVVVKPVSIGYMPAAWFEPANRTTETIVFYLHGGGYFAGSIKSHGNLMGRIAKAASARVFAIEYRLAPEHPFPAALDDAKNAYLWLLTQSFNPQQIIFAGDSAGAGLAMSVLIDLRDNRLPLPAATVCLSPWVDLTLSGETMMSKAHSDPMLKAFMPKKAAQMYLQDRDPQLPLASPLFADLSGLPPLFIQVGTSEILLSDAVRLAEKAKMAGVQVLLDVWEDMWHVWPFFADIIPEGRQAIQQIGQFIKGITPLNINI